MISVSPSANKLHFTIILLTYLICSLIFGFAYRFAMNPDGISLIRLAGYIAEGNFQRSVTSAYSPLITWVVSPFIFLGFEGLTAARISIAVSGAVLLFAGWFFALRFELSDNLRFISLLIAALLTSFWTVQNIGADVLFAALLLFYFYFVTNPDTLIQRRISFLCGLTGGFSYLAHHYALPFFLVHFPTMLFLRGYIDRKNGGLPWKNVLISWASGIVGFLIIASLWVGIASVKYGKLSISAKGGAAHAIMGPDDVDRRHPFFVGGLFKPRDDYAIHVFEDPSEVEFKTWSPFENKEYFLHQLKVIKRNAVYILHHFVTESPFFTYAFVIGIFTLILLALLLNPLNRKKKFLYAWVVVTFCIYCSGFLVLIARSPRRFYALMIVFIFLSFHFMEELKNSLRDVVADPGKKVLMVFLLLMAVAAFSIKPGIQLMKSAKYLVTHEQINVYKEIADQINSVEFPDPYAVVRSSQKPTTDYYIAYFLRKQLLGRPMSKDVEGITRELSAADARSLLVFDNLEMVERFKLDKRYIHIASVKLQDNKRYESAVNVNVSYHEIITGWDSEVNIFSFK